MTEYYSARIIISFVISLFFVGMIIDRLIVKDNMASWRKGILEIWEKMNRPDIGSLTDEVNNSYLSFFDSIYSGRMFSKRRIVASIITSIIGMAVVTFVVGVDGSYWVVTPDLFPGQSSIVMELYWLISLPILTNLPADFISLAETRLILRFSQRRGVLLILICIGVDFILTSFVFGWGMAAILFSDDVVFFNIIESKVFVNFWTNGVLLFTDPTVFFNSVSDKETFLIFYATTFFTSVIWFVFVITYLCIRMAHRFAPITNYILYEISRSKNPAMMIAFAINSALLVVIAAWELIRILW